MAWLSGLFGRWGGASDGQSIDRLSVSLAAPWAHEAPAWLLFGCLAIVAGAVAFYFRWQVTKRPWARTAMAICRAVALCLALLALAEPTMTLTLSTRLRPSLWLLFDGTDSMAMTDEPSVPAAAGQTEAARPVSRVDQVRGLLEDERSAWLARLEKKFRLRAFVFERPDSARQLELAPSGQTKIDAKHLSSQLTTTGQVTALGGALADLARRHTTESLAGMVVVSDFNQNTGPSAVEAARQLGAKVYTVGVGPASASDVSIALQAPLVAKKDERTSLAVTVNQQGYSRQPVTVRVTARAAGGDDQKRVVLGEKSVRLAEGAMTLDFPYVPAEVGQFDLLAEVEALPGETTVENNRAQRDISVRDDFIRLMFVEYEPTWEWRFIKEVFHRDKLVGMRGFRTFLRSADPKVRQTNELFLPTLTPPRAEFFANDVIMLGDVPAAALSTRFGELVEEFVGKFGGGLVVIAGARFGPAQLADTPIAKMLPVVFEPNATPRDRELFRPRMRGEAEQIDFMQLGSDAGESRKAWANLGELSWYQPSARVHPLAQVLAEHPTDKCSDGKTAQPLVAMRRYGRGEVVYLAFNEMWRLRRKYGELYYRQFWGQMIHRLALSHALGTQKRFVVRTDRQRYQAEDFVVVTVEAYDNEFQPMADSAVPGGALRGELALPEGQGSAQPLSLPALRKGTFESRFQVFAGGEHRVRVTDPLTSQPVEVSFQVASASVERQRPVRNVALQDALAEATGGKAYDIAGARRLPDEMELTARSETRAEVIPLWSTWPYFLAIGGCLLLEWLLRKWVNLP